MLFWNDAYIWYVLWRDYRYKHGLSVAKIVVQGFMRIADLILNFIMVVIILTLYGCTIQCKYKLFKQLGDKISLVCLFASVFTKLNILDIYLNYWSHKTSFSYIYTIKLEFKVCMEIKGYKDLIWILKCPIWRLFTNWSAEKTRVFFPKGENNYFFSLYQKNRLRCWSICGGTTPPI